MENQKNSQSEESIRTALTTKWAKLTAPEVKEIMSDHSKLTSSLKSRYSMTKEEAQSASVTFFKPYEVKKVVGQKL